MTTISVLVYVIINVITYYTNIIYIIFLRIKKYSIIIFFSV